MRLKSASMSLNVAQPVDEPLYGDVPRKRYDD
jgi:hypothetical protein